MSTRPPSTGLVLSTTGAARIVTFTDTTLVHILQNEIDSQYALVPLKKDLSMWVNDSIGQSNLPINRAATALWTEIFGPSDVIVGDVFLTGGSCQRTEEVLGLNEEQIRFLVAFVVC